MKQPIEGGSYVYDPKKESLKQVQKPTAPQDPNAKPPAPAEPAAPSTSDEGESLKKGN